MRNSSVSGTLTGEGKTSAYPYQTRVNLVLGETQDIVYERVGDFLTPDDLHNQPFDTQHALLTKNGFTISQQTQMNNVVIYSNESKTHTVMLLKGSGLVKIGNEFIHFGIREYNLEFDDMSILGGFTIVENGKFYFYQLVDDTHLEPILYPDSLDGGIDSHDKYLDFLQAYFESKRKGLQKN